MTVRDLATVVTVSVRPRHIVRESCQRRSQEEEVKLNCDSEKPAYVQFSSSWYHREALMTGWSQFHVIPLVFEIDDRWTDAHNMNFI